MKRIYKVHIISEKLGKFMKKNGILNSPTT